MSEESIEQSDSIDVSQLLESGEFKESCKDCSLLAAALRGTKLDSEAASNLLTECKKLHGAHRTFDIFRRMNIDFVDVKSGAEFLHSAAHALKSRPLRQLSVYLNDVKTKLETIEKENDMMKIEMKQMKAQNTASDDGLLKMGALITDFISGNANLKKESAAKEEELRELRMRLAVKEKKYAEKEKKVSSLREVNKKKDAKIEKLKGYLKAKDNDLIAKEETIATLQKELAELKKMIPQVAPRAKSELPSPPRSNRRSENYEELKKCKKDASSFDRIYGIISKCGKENDETTLREAVECGMVDVRDKQGANIILKAAEKGNLSLVRQLHDFGADIYAKDNDGWTILHQFCQAGSVEGIKYAIQFFDVNEATNSKWTPLHVVSYWGRVPCAEFLCAMSNVKKNELDDKKRTPLKLAQMNCEHVVAEVLRWYGCTL